MDRPVRRCSFCGKKQDEVRLVAGPAEVYICHLCVALCNEILTEQARAGQASAEAPSPHEPGGGGWIGTTARHR